MPEELKNEEFENITGGYSQENDKYSFKEGESFQVDAVKRYVVYKDSDNLGLDDPITVKLYISNPATHKESFFETTTIPVRNLLNIK